jgi:hypothetical protein
MAFTHRWLRVGDSFFYWVDVMVVRVLLRRLTGGDFSFRSTFSFFVLLGIGGGTIVFIASFGCM